MNENTTAIIDAIAEKFGVVIDWTSQNILPYLEDLMHRIVSFEIGISTFWMIFCLIVAVGLVFLGYHMYQRCKKDSPYDEEDSMLFPPAIFTWILAGVAVVATIVIIPVGVIRILECINIPEKIFLEYIGAFGG